MYQPDYQQDELENVGFLFSFSFYLWSHRFPNSSYQVLSRVCGGEGICVLRMHHAMREASHIWHLCPSSPVVQHVTSTASGKEMRQSQRTTKHCCTFPSKEWNLLPTYGNACKMKDLQCLSPSISVPNPNNYPALKNYYTYPDTKLRLCL